jgi:hypothetical protein
VADTAPEIKVILTGEDRGVAAAIKELGNQLSTLKQKEQEVAESSFNLAGAFQALVASAVVLKLAEFGKEVFTTSLNMARLSEKIGVSSGFLSTFSKAAESSGVSTEQVSISLGRLATNITQFQQGGTKAAAAMKALGISQAELKNLSPDEAIRLVTNRLGEMHAGLQKAAIAQQLMGKGGQALIPTLNLLAGEGFDKLTAAAKASGQYIDDDMAADTRSAAAALEELAGQAKGAATQFEAGLLPAVTEAADGIMSAIGDDGLGGGFRQLGKYAGTFIKGVVAGFLSIGVSAGTAAATMEEVLDYAFNHTKQFAKTTFAAVGGFIRGGVAEAAVAAAQQMTSATDTATQEFVARILAIQKTADDAQQKIIEKLFPDEKPKLPKAKPVGDDSGKIDDEKRDKAALAAREAMLQEQLALDKANNAAEESANQIAYNEGLESLRAYFNKKKQLAQTDVDERVAILRQEKAATAAAPTDGTAAEEIAKKQKLAKFDSDIALAQIAGTQKQGELESEYFLAKEAHQKTFEGYQSEILKLQGNTYAAALAQIEGESAAIKRNLAQAGLSPEAIAALMAQLEQLKTSSAAFDENKKQGEDALRSLANEKADIELRVTAGMEGQRQADEEIAKLELSRVATLNQIAAAMAATAVNPQQVQAAEDFARHVREIQVNAAAAANEMQQFGKQAGKAIESDLNTFLTTTIFKAHTVGQAFRELAGSAVGSIQKIVTARLLELATDRLIKALKLGEDSTAIASAAAKGAAQAGPLIAASATLTTAGGVITTGATALGVSAAALEAAAQTLIIANSMGGAGGGQAAGGLILGPGTSTSDSIPARLSTGEFVVRAAAVNAIGVSTLRAINAGIRIPSVATLAVPRFAEGGLVQGHGAHGGTMDVKLGLDEGLVLKHLATKGAGRIILQHLSDNPKAATKAIGRGGK